MCRIEVEIEHESQVAYGERKKGRQLLVLCACLRGGKGWWVIWKEWDIGMCGERQRGLWRAVQRWIEAGIES